MKGIVICLLSFVLAIPALSGEFVFSLSTNQTIDAIVATWADDGFGPGDIPGQPLGEDWFLWLKQPGVDGWDWTESWLKQDCRSSFTSSMHWSAVSQTSQGVCLRLSTQPWNHVSMWSDGRQIYDQTWLTPGRHIIDVYASTVPEPSGLVALLLGIEACFLLPKHRQH
jgi:hypothetical protein